MTDEADNNQELERSVPRIYEVGYCVIPTVPEANLHQEVTAIKDILLKEGANVISEEFPKIRTLFYPIRGKGGHAPFFTNCYFGWVKFEVGREHISRIEVALRLLPCLLRFIVVKTVRENTLLHTHRARQEFRRAPSVAPKDAPASPAVSEQELEKSLKKIIAA